MAPNNSIEITHVIFDLDGLLLDSEKCYERAFENITLKFGAKLNFELRKQLTGMPMRDCAKLVINRLDIPLSIDQFAVLFEMECSRLFSHQIPLMPGAERLVRHLYSCGIPIAIATSSERINFELKTSYYRDLFDLFDHVLCTPDDPEVVRGKPDPQPFLVCASRFVHRPQDGSTVLVFEDSVAGIKGANAAGMRSVWVPDSRMPTDAVQPFVRLNSLEHFQPQLFGLPPFE